MSRRPLQNDPEPIVSTAEVESLASRVRAAGEMFIDLEFVSESRYVPELALIQIGWGDPDAPSIAAVDPLTADPRPLVELVADETVSTVLHSGQGDLSLLATHFEIEARALYDTQLAAAFLGLADQIGYGGLVETLAGVELDKSMQFTDWLARPLSEAQLRYALDDVRYLPAVWRELESRLRAAGRLAWLAEESALLARTAVRRPEPGEAYQRVGGWRKLRGQRLATLQALAEWRELEALESNRPPAWILKNKSLSAVARRLPRTLHELKKIEGVGQGTARRYGREILEVVARGASAPPPEPASGRGMTTEARKLGGDLFAFLRELCREHEIATRVVVSRDQADQAALWWLTGDRRRPPELPLFTGWRDELAGEAAREWLATADTGSAQRTLAL